MMKPEYCPDYVGVACVDGTCPVANCEEYAVKKEVYNWDGVEWIVTEALAHGNKVVINADW